MHYIISGDSECVSKEKKKTTTDNTTLEEQQCHVFLQSQLLSGDRVNTCHVQLYWVKLIISQRQHNNMT